LREAMSRHVGLERDAQGLMHALSVIDRVEKAGNGEAALLNMTAAARLVTAAALARQESRGGHWRGDFPGSDAHGQRTVLTLAAAEAIAATPPQRHAVP
jgi:L-aspartate oxidase